MQKHRLRGAQRTASWACGSGKQHLPAWHWAQESRLHSGGERKGETELIHHPLATAVLFDSRLSERFPCMLGSQADLCSWTEHAYRSANQPQELLPITTSKIQVSRGLCRNPSSYAQGHFKHFYRLFSKPHASSPAIYLSLSYPSYLPFLPGFFLVLNTNFNLF